MVKKSGILGGQGKLPTIVSPEEYQKRFIEAMHRYFLEVPDHWTGLGKGIDLWIFDLTLPHFHAFFNGTNTYILNCIYYICWILPNIYNDMYSTEYLYKYSKIFMYNIINSIYLCI